MVKSYTFLFFTALLFSFQLWGQNDTLVARDNTVIVGDIKTMNKGVLKMKTSYSDSDFAIEWSQVKRISSMKEFIISTMDGDINYGALRSDKDDEVVVYVADVDTATLALDQIVFIRTIKTDFLSRLSASLAMGYNFTKSNNLSQINLRSTIGYKAKNWTLNANFNGISSTRDDVNAVERLDAALSYRYFLKNDWYPMIEVNWLANTEQNIQLRTVARTGMGKYLLRSNKMYWGMQAGTSYNNETFTSGPIATQNSLEGFLASELNLYDMGDLTLLTRVVAYPGITEAGRMRVDGVLDLQYDLPLDFFIKLGFTVNYDNRSVLSTNDYDYIFQTSFGWQL